MWLRASILVLIVLYETDVTWGHSLAKLQINNGEDIYEVQEDRESGSIRFINPKSRAPTLREIIYYHIIEKPYSESTAPVDKGETTKPFTNSHGYSADYEELDENISPDGRNQNTAEIEFMGEVPNESQGQQIVEISPGEEMPVDEDINNQEKDVIEEELFPGYEIATPKAVEDENLPEMYGADKTQELQDDDEDLKYEFPVEEDSYAPETEDDTNSQFRVYERPELVQSVNEPEISEDNEPEAAEMPENAAREELPENNDMSPEEQYMEAAEVERDEPDVNESEEMLPTDEQQAEEQPAYDPGYYQPAIELSTDGQPAYDPGYFQPGIQLSGDEQPAYDSGFLQPINEIPAEEQPADEEPADEQPAYDPGYFQPGLQLSGDDQPAYDSGFFQPINEIPAEEQPTDEQSADEEPADGQPPYDPGYFQPAFVQPADEQTAYDPGYFQPAYELGFDPSSFVQHMPNEESEMAEDMVPESKDNELGTVDMNAVPSEIAEEDSAEHMLEGEPLLEDESEIGEELRTIHESNDNEVANLESDVVSGEIANEEDVQYIPEEENLLEDEPIQKDMLFQPADDSDMRYNTYIEPEVEDYEPKTIDGGDIDSINNEPSQFKYNPAIEEEEISAEEEPVDENLQEKDYEGRNSAEEHLTPDQENLSLEEEERSPADFLLMPEESNEVPDTAEPEEGNYKEPSAIVLDDLANEGNSRPEVFDLLAEAEDAEMEPEHDLEKRRAYLRNIVYGSPEALKQRYEKINAFIAGTRPSALLSRKRRAAFSYSDIPEAPKLPYYYGDMPSAEGRMYRASDFDQSDEGMLEDYARIQNQGRTYGMLMQNGRGVVWNNLNRPGMQEVGDMETLSESMENAKGPLDLDEVKEPEDLSESEENFEVRNGDLESTASSEENKEEYREPIPEESYESRPAQEDLPLREELKEVEATPEESFIGDELHEVADTDDIMKENVEEDKIEEPQDGAVFVNSGYHFIVGEKEDQIEPEMDHEEDIQKEEKPNLIASFLEQKEFLDWLTAWMTSYTKILEEYIDKAVDDRISLRRSLIHETDIEEPINENIEEDNKEDNKVSTIALVGDETIAGNMEDGDLLRRGQRKKEKEIAPIRAEKIYGNSVGNEKVTNVFIFFPEDTQRNEALEQLKPIIDDKESIHASGLNEASIIQELKPINNLPSEMVSTVSGEEQRPVISPIWIEQPIEEHANEGSNIAQTMEEIVGSPIQQTPLVEPIQQTPLVEPIQETPLVEPIEEIPSIEPIQETLLVEPIEEIPFVEPIEETPLVEPIEETPMVGPIEEFPMVGPVEESPMVGPIEESPMVGSIEESPMVGSIEESPMVEPNEEHIEEAPLENPIEEHIEETPLVEPVENTPMEEPMRENIISQPGLEEQPEEIVEEHLENNQEKPVIEEVAEENAPIEHESEGQENIVENPIIAEGEIPTDEQSLISEEHAVESPIEENLENKPLEEHSEILENSSDNEPSENLRRLDESVSDSEDVAPVEESPELSINESESENIIPVEEVAIVTPEPMREDEPISAADSLEPSISDATELETNLGDKTIAVEEAALDEPMNYRTVPESLEPSMNVAEPNRDIDSDMAVKSVMEGAGLDEQMSDDRAATDISEPEMKAEESPELLPIPETESNMEEKPMVAALDEPISEISEQEMKSEESSEPEITEMGSNSEQTPMAIEEHLLENTNERASEDKSEILEQGAAEEIAEDSMNQV